LVGNRRFEVDRAGRVTGVQAAGWSERYAYDEAGNLAQGQWQDARQQQVSGAEPIQRAGDVRYRYDAQGRVVLRQKKRLSRKPDSWHYSWDAQDRLVGVVTPDGAGGQTATTLLVGASKSNASVRTL
jgi:YD repeat-containing protein